MPVAHVSDDPEGRWPDPRSRPLFRNDIELGKAVIQKPPTVRSAVYSELIPPWTVSVAASSPPTFAGVQLDSAKPPWPLLRRYQSDGDWQAYAADYGTVLDKREPLILRDLREIVDGYTDATLCGWCHDPGRCRRLFAEWLQSHDVAVEVR